MRTILLAILVALLATVAPATAHVAHVTTSVSATDVKDETAFRAAVDTAIKRALAETIAFKPSLVGVTGMKVVGDRVLIGLLFADDEGKAMLDALGDKAVRGDPREDGAEEKLKI